LMQRAFSPSAVPAKPSTRTLYALTLPIGAMLPAAHSESLISLLFSTTAFDGRNCTAGYLRRAVSSHGAAAHTTV
jgi:hypothetical protein